MPITYVDGDAMSPQAVGNKIIAHVCNDEGKWGKGFVLAVSKKYPQVEAAYRQLYAAPSHPKLGHVQLVEVQSSPEKIFVANMIAQRGVKKMKDGTAEGCPPLRYPALYSCLEEVVKMALANNATIHAPRIGAGLAGGDWRLVEAVLKVLEAKSSANITIYNFKDAVVDEEII